MARQPRTVVGFSAFRRLLDRRSRGSRVARGALVRLCEATEDLVRDLVRRAVRAARREGLRTLHVKHLEEALLRG